jgi:nucleolar GTP-binding protein
MLKSSSLFLQAVLESQAKGAAAKPARRLERDIQEEEGGAGVYSAKLQKHHMLADESWRDDVVPEIMDGKNIADFIDPDIMQRLEELERLEEGASEDEEEMEEDDMTAEEKEALQVRGVEWAFLLCLTVECCVQRRC